MAAKFSFFQGYEGYDFSKTDKQSNFKKILSSFHSTSLQWNGGNKDTYKTSLEHIEQSDLKAWVESLEYSPVPLLRSPVLYPLYHIVAEVSIDKSEKMQIAMDLALKVELTYQPPRVDDRATTAI